MSDYLDFVVISSEQGSPSRSLRRVAGDRADVKPQCELACSMPLGVQGYNIKGKFVGFGARTGIISFGNLSAGAFSGT